MAIRLSAKEFQAQFGSSLGNQVVGGAPKKPAKPQIRIPKASGANKTETEWMGLCKTKHPNATAILYEPWSLRLPSGTKYTPDVVVVEPFFPGHIITCYEVKGPHIHQSGARSILAFKEARAAYPWIIFVFAQKREDGWTTDC